MYIITSGNKILEITSSIRYAKDQPNGVRILCDIHNASYVHSIDSDILYHLSSHRVYKVDSIPESDNIIDEYEYNGIDFIKSSYGLLKDQLNIMIGGEI